MLPFVQQSSFLSAPMYLTPLTKAAVQISQVLGNSH